MSDPMEQDDAVPQDQVADAGENADVKTEPSDVDKSAWHTELAFAWFAATDQE